MNAYEVKLAPHGFFEIPATCPDGISFRVGYNPDVKFNPWSVLTQDDEGIKWCCVRSFGDLDRALSFAVSQVLEESAGVEFRVNLPCGRSFKRPGRIAAENVMASMGWLYVHELVAYGGLLCPELSSPEEAEEAFKDLLDGTMVSLDDVDYVGDDFVSSDNGYWCAKYLLPYDGFLHLDRIESEIVIAFKAEGVEIFPEVFDFNCRKLAIATSPVINLQEYRAAKAKAA